LIPEIVCLSILSIQIIYIILFLYAFLKKEKRMQGNHPPVSVIVCAHDEEENLKILIPQLLAMDYSEFEVIIIEDRSNDDTFDYLLEATKANSRLKMVRVQQTPEHINGKKFGLTLGIKAAHYDWVLFTDADCRPGPNWIREMSSHFTDKTEIVLGFSPYVKLPGFLNSFIRFETYLTAIQYIGFALIGRPYMGVGRNLAYRKSLFINNKGFNTHLSVMGGDDDLFVNEHATGKNTDVSIGREVLVYSQPETTFVNYYYQKLRHLSVGKKYKFADRAVLGLFSISWILTWLVVLPYAPFSPWIYLIGAVFLLRWVLLISLFHFAPKRLGDGFETWKTPFLDFIYAFYYLVAGLMALVSKKVRWKKN
jgi:cellulose synthase/poly-beta-1,6-N-acetylglucosamine synthase-like glycosyltransferase